MYMIYQQVTTAVKEVYVGKEDVARQAERARQCREWLESLRIDGRLRDSLVEPIKVLEEAFQDLARSSS